MNERGDWETEMERFSLDADSADRLLRGALDPEDAPHRYGEVAALLQAAVVPTTDSLGGEAAAVTAIVEAIRSAPPAVQPSRRTTMVTKAKIAAAGLAGALSLTTGLAAANALPGAVQAAASDALATVGVDVPNPNHHAGSHPAVRGKSGDHVDEAGTDTSTPDNKGSEISDLAKNTPPGPDHGATVSNVASDGKSHAGEDHGAANDSHGPPSTTPGSEHAPVTTPANNGGTHSEGNTTADDHRNGAASDGQSNAGGRKP